MWDDPVARTLIALREAPNRIAGRLGFASNLQSRPSFGFANFTFLGRDGDRELAYDFYAWLVRPRSRRSLDDEKLGAQVHQSFVSSNPTYGARGVWRDVLEQRQACGMHRIERLMREQALRAYPRRRGLPNDRGERSAIADNVLD